MLYLLDANVLIDANRDYYQINRVPEFWEWLFNMGSKGLVKIPLEVFEELREGKDNLSNWARDPNNISSLLLKEEAEVSLVSRVTNEGYANDLSDDEIEKIGRDPFIIAYALIESNGRCIVTTETSKPNRRRANRHLPDVCNSFDIKWCSTFEFLRYLDFSTNWKT